MKILLTKSILMELDALYSQNLVVVVCIRNYRLYVTVGCCVSILREIYYYYIIIITYRALTVYIYLFMVNV